MILAQYARDFGKAVYSGWQDGNRVSKDLFIVLIPIILIVKILNETGIIEYVALPLKPIMTMVGLPAELGLAWAAAMLINIYSGIIVLLSLIPILPPLSVGQITTFSLMLLIAHNLILECKLANQCGVSILSQLALRLLMAVAGGLIVYWFCRLSGLFAGPAQILLEGKPPLTLAQWAQSEVLNLCKIYFLIWGVMLLQKGLEHFKITTLLSKILAPVLRLLGISPRAATIIIISFTMGLIYGSGLIIQSVRKGELSRHDMFCTMSLMGVAHSLIEDTLLMLLLGSSLWGVMVLRLAMALALGVIINMVYKRTMRGKTTGTLNA